MRPVPLLRTFSVICASTIPGRSELRPVIRLAGINFPALSVHGDVAARSALVAVALASLEEGLPVHLVVRGRIELCGLTVAGDTDERPDRVGRTPLAGARALTPEPVE